MSDVIPSAIEEELAKTGKLIYSNHGGSMLPLIKEGRDLVVIVTPPSGRLKKYDVPLYKRGDSRKYVLHRIIRVIDDGYVIRGDNCYFKELDVKDDDIIGVLSCVIRKGGREVSVDSFGYKLYSRVWCLIYPLRFCYAKVRAFGGRVMRKIGLKK